MNLFNRQNGLGSLKNLSAGFFQAACAPKQPENAKKCFQAACMLRKLLLRMAVFVLDFRKS
jgi:hypothetical protein